MTNDITLEINDEMPLRDGVFQTLRRAILTGTIMPGERLMELHLANQLGVSRTPIREAIHKLELEGLVVITPGRGAAVANITIEDMKDVLEVRRALDMLCAELACERIDACTLEKLESACIDFEQATKDEDINKVAACDVKFHDIILYATGNSKLIQMVHNLSEQMYRYRFEYIKDTDAYGQLIKEHKEIYDAIAKRDKNKAGASAGLHIDNQEKAIMKMISSEE